jgi:hypothetical protein
MQSHTGIQCKSLVMVTIWSKSGVWPEHWDTGFREIESVWSQIVSLSEILVSV